MTTEEARTSHPSAVNVMPRRRAPVCVRVIVPPIGSCPDNDPALIWQSRISNRSEVGSQQPWQLFPLAHSVRMLRMERLVPQSVTDYSRVLFQELEGVELDGLTGEAQPNAAAGKGREIVLSIPRHALMNIVPVQSVGALLAESGNGLLLTVENLHLEPAPRAGIPY